MDRTGERKRQDPDVVSLHGKADQLKRVQNSSERGLTVAAGDFDRDKVSLGSDPYDPATRCRAVTGDQTGEKGPVPIRVGKCSFSCQVRAGNDPATQVGMVRDTGIYQRHSNPLARDPAGP